MVFKFTHLGRAIPNKTGGNNGNVDIEGHKNTQKKKYPKKESEKSDSQKMCFEMDALQEHAETASLSVVYSLSW